MISILPLLWLCLLITRDPPSSTYHYYYYCLKTLLHLISNSWNNFTSSFRQTERKRESTSKRTIAIWTFNLEFAYGLYDMNPKWEEICAIMDSWVSKTKWMSLFIEDDEASRIILLHPSRQGVQFGKNKHFRAYPKMVKLSPHFALTRHFPSLCKPCVKF